MKVAKFAKSDPHLLWAEMGTGMWDSALTPFPSLQSPPRTSYRPSDSAASLVRGLVPRSSLTWGWRCPVVPDSCCELTAWRKCLRWYGRVDSRRQDFQHSTSSFIKVIFLCFALNIQIGEKKIQTETKGECYFCSKNNSIKQPHRVKRSKDKKHNSHRIFRAMKWLCRILKW